MASQYVRQTAIPCSVLDISSGAWVRNDGLVPSGVQTERGMISRASIIGVIIEKHSDISFSLDDGTNIINVRAFDAKPQIGGAIGDVVLVVGKPREYNGERYIVLEICKKLRNPGWIQYRKTELSLFAQLMPVVAEQELARKRAFTAQVVAAAQAEQASGASPAVEELVSETDAANPFERILASIRQLDSGGGADMEEVIAAVSHPECETLFKTLLEEGEIFEVRPGRVKVLE